MITELILRCSRMLLEVRPLCISIPSKKIDSPLLFIFEKGKTNSVHQVE